MNFSPGLSGSKPTPQDSWGSLLSGRFCGDSRELSRNDKFLANEPSAGLFYIQQHVHNAIPNLANLKAKVADRCREATLRTEDSEDSIAMARSMKNCGFRISPEIEEPSSSSFAAADEEEEEKEADKDDDLPVSSLIHPFLNGCYEEMSLTARLEDWLEETGDRKG
ncbi:unnamed protein product [Cuscuta campestris]|uniref:Uncharacterized protein n=1 Tax=Cuscuta campestris TaxID=132261 RepID=A0A484N1U7_9ASTE|nr:unnamed protein product [Cuscuta campestris]